MCQDTGTAIISGKRGGEVLTDGATRALGAGGLRRLHPAQRGYFPACPLNHLVTADTAQPPAQIELYAAPGASTVPSDGQSPGCQHIVLNQQTKAGAETRPACSRSG